MSLVVSETGGGSNIPILAEGTYSAVCYMLADIGLQYNEKYGNSSRKVIIGWEIAGEYVEIDGENQPRVFSARYTASLNEKSILRRDLVAWRGRDFTESELSEFNLCNILGASCLLQVVHKETNGRKYANLAAIMKLPKGMNAPKLTLNKIMYDIDDNDQTEFDKLPEWIQKTIMASESYKKRTDSGTTTSEFTADIDDDVLPF